MERPETQKIIYCCKPAEVYEKESMDKYIRYLLKKICIANSIIKSCRIHGLRG